MDPDEQRFPALNRNLDVDVAIVGAGFAGIGAAWALRDSGASFVVLEQRTVASGASGRNAGFLLAGSALSFRLTIERWGLEAALNIWRFTKENNGLLAQLIEGLAIECGFLRRGSMSLAADDAEWGDLRAEYQSLAAAAIGACLVERPDLPAPLPARYSGGLYWGGNGELNPAAFLRGLAAHFQEGTILERTPVTGLGNDGSWLLETPAGQVRAHAVILATNAWTAEFLPDVQIVPTRGQVLATSPLPRVVVPFPLYANRGFQYWRQTADGRLVVGGWRDLDIPREVGTDEILHGNIQASLDDFAHYIAPHHVVEHRWAGIMGFTPDLMPLVGAVPGRDGLFLAAGFSGHGVSLAFNCGRHVARRVVGVRSAVPAPFDPARLAATQSV